MKPIKERSHSMSSTKNNSLLFLKNSRISITLELNKKKYEYGFDRKLCYERLINYLAFFEEI